MQLRKIIYFLCAIVGIILFIVMIFQSGIFENLNIFLKVNTLLIFLGLALSTAIVIIKIIRWQMLSKSYSVDVSFLDATVIILGGGFVGGVTPGKVGDLIKADIMKSRYTLPLAKGFTMVFYERIFELSIIFLVSMGILFLRLPAKYYLFLQVTLILLVFFGLVYLFFDKIKGICWNLICKLGVARLSWKSISLEKISNRDALQVFSLTLMAMGLEFIRIWLVCQAFGYQVNIIHLSVFFSLSVLIGLLSQVPIGIGVVEGSMTFFLESMGIPSYSAFGIVIIDRLISMYYVILLGFIYYTKILKHTIDGEENLDNNTNI